MAENFDSTNPIYLQLANRIKRQMVNGELQPGVKLPSVRETAIQSGVNPNTVQKTYAELERTGMAESRRGKGTFVTENEVVLKEVRDQLKQEKVQSFVDDMQALGFETSEMIDGIVAYTGTKSHTGGRRRD